MATTNSDIDISNYPCAVCMGFCLEDEDCIQCNLCFNWFHKECVNLSNKKFKLLGSNINAKFTCTICIHKKKCEVCEKTQTQSRVRFLYCVTCLKHFCDDCNPFLCDQIDEYRSTDNPFYCSSCSAFYPCKVCGKHCYQDAIHQPFIVCSGCKSRVHSKCSKLKRSQLNKLSSTNVNTYLCNICRSESLPFTKLSTAALKNVLLVDDDTGKVSKGPELHKQCTLCVQCNSDCEECTACPDNFRVCADCSTVCNYFQIQELNTALSNMRLNDLGLVHVNIRSLKKNLDKFENMLDHLDRKPDIICITETKLNENVASDLDDIVLHDSNVINITGYKFYHTLSTTNAGGAGLYVSNMCSYKVRNDLNICIDGECEAKFVEIITSSKKSKNIIVGSMYRHPHDSNHQAFFSEFSKKIECIQKKVLYCVIRGH